MDRKSIYVVLAAFLLLSGCATVKKQEAGSLSREEIIELQLKQTLAIAETSLEVSRNAEKLATEALEKSRQAEATSAKALDAANKAVEAANEARKFAEEETQKAINAANEARKVAEQESEKAIAASNRASKLAMDHADKSAELAIKAANDAIKAANASSEKSIAVANQTIAEINRLRATVVMQPPEEPIVMEEPKAEKTYVIKKGDTLSSIADKEYGDASKWHVIYQKNRDVLKTPGNIKSGTKIIIP